MDAQGPRTGHRQAGSVGDIEFGHPDQRLVLHTDHRFHVRLAGPFGGDGHGYLAGRILSTGAAHTGDAWYTAAGCYTEGLEERGERIGVAAGEGPGVGRLWWILGAHTGTLWRWSQRISCG